MPNVELPQAEFKVVMLGDTNVGKTSLVLRFTEGYYRESSRHPTVGAFFLTKRVQTTSGITCKVQIWDTAGQPQFRSILPMYYKTAAAAIVCFDIMNSESWYSAKEWLDELKVAKENGTIVVALVATKRDLLYEETSGENEGEDDPDIQANQEKDSSFISQQSDPSHTIDQQAKRKLQYLNSTKKLKHNPLYESILQEAKELSKALDIIFVDTSSRDDENVDYLFQKVAEKVLHIKELENDSSSGLQPGNIPVTAGASIDALGRVIKTVPNIEMNRTAPTAVQSHSYTDSYGRGNSSSNLNPYEGNLRLRSNSFTSDIGQQINLEKYQATKDESGDAGLCMGVNGILRCSSEKDTCHIS